MDTKQIGTKLVELCRSGKNLDAISALYSRDVVSVEAAANPIAVNHQILSDCENHDATTTGMMPRTCGSEVSRFVIAKTHGNQKNAPRRYQTEMKARASLRARNRAAPHNPMNRNPANMIHRAASGKLLM